MSGSKPLGTGSGTDITTHYASTQTSSTERLQTNVEVEKIQANVESGPGMEDHLSFGPNTKDGRSRAQSAPNTGNPTIQMIQSSSNADWEDPRMFEAILSKIGGLKDSKAAKERLYESIRADDKAIFLETITKDSHIGENGLEARKLVLNTNNFLQICAGDIIRGWVLEEMKSKTIPESHPHYVKTRNGSAIMKQYYMYVRFIEEIYLHVYLIGSKEDGGFEAALRTGEEEEHAPISDEKDEDTPLRGQIHPRLRTTGPRFKSTSMLCTRPCKILLCGPVEKTNYKFDRASVLTIHAIDRNDLFSRGRIDQTSARFSKEEWESYGKLGRLDNGERVTAAQNGHWRVESAPRHHHALEAAASVGAGRPAGNVRSVASERGAPKSPAISSGAGHVGSTGHCTSTSKYSAMASYKETNRVTKHAQGTMYDRGRSIASSRGGYHAHPTQPGPSDERTTGTLRDKFKDIWNADDDNTRASGSRYRR